MHGRQSKVSYARNNVTYNWLFTNTQLAFIIGAVYHRFCELPVAACNVKGILCSTLIRNSDMSALPDQQPSVQAHLILKL